MKQHRRCVAVIVVALACLCLSASGLSLADIVNVKASRSRTAAHQAKEDAELLRKAAKRNIVVARLEGDKWGVDDPDDFIDGRMANAILEAHIRMLERVIDIGRAPPSMFRKVLALNETDEHKIVEWEFESPVANCITKRSCDDMALNLCNWASKKLPGNVPQLSGSLEDGTCLAVCGGGLRIVATCREGFDKGNSQSQRFILGMD